MKARYGLFGVFLVLFIAIGLTLTAWLARPRVVEITPPPGGVDVPVTSPIRLIFSRAVKPEMVEDTLQIEPAQEGRFSWDGNTLTFIPDKPWPGGQEISLSLKAGVKAASWLAFPMKGLSWSFKTSQAYQLAYLWPSDGPADIYLMNPPTGEILQVTHSMGVLDFSASRDGSTIYFSASNHDGGSSLYRIDRIEAASATSLAYTPDEVLDCGTAQCRSPSVSSDNSYLAYEYLAHTPEGETGAAVIWLMDLGTKETKALGQTAHETVQPAWSSDGWLAFYDRTSNTYEMIDPITQARESFPNQTGQPGSWSPDGEYYLAPEIYYIQASGNGETGISHLMRYNRESEASDDLSGSADVEDVEGIYSPDGKSIAFERKFLDEAHWTFGRQIWIMNQDGSNAHMITEEADYNHYDLAWDQDGRVLAYVRFNQAKLSDPPELWMINVDGSGPVLLVKGGYSPAWIP